MLIWFIYTKIEYEVYELCESKVSTWDEMFADEEVKIIENKAMLDNIFEYVENEHWNRYYKKQYSSNSKYLVNILQK